MYNTFLDIDEDVKSAQEWLTALLRDLDKIPASDGEWPELEEFREKVKEAKILLRIPDSLEECIAQEEERLEREAGYYDAQNY